MKEQSEKQEGSEANFTVEATLLIPLITAIIIAIIQLCFVLHDRIILEEGLEHVLSREIADKGQRDEGFQEIEERLLISRLMDSAVLEKKTEVMVSATMESGWIVPFFFRRGQGLCKEYHAGRKLPHQKEKTILCEIFLDMTDRR